MPSQAGRQERPTIEALLESYRVPTPTDAGSPVAPPAPAQETMGELLTSYKVKTPAQRVAASQPQTPDPPDQEPLSPFWRIVNDVMIRPQAAMFAGVREGLDSADEAAAAGGKPLIPFAADTMGRVFSTVLDEYTSGLGTGRFKRNVGGADLLQGEAGERLKLGLRAMAFGFAPVSDRQAGLALDVGADPLALVPSKVFSAPFRAAKFIGGVGLDAAKGAPKIGRSVTATTDFLKSAFRETIPKTAAARAATEAVRYIDNLVETHRTRLAGELRENSRTLGTLASEAGMDVDELQRLITNANKEITLEDASMGMPESAQNTFERIYAELGVDEFDKFVSSGGGRILADEAPLRRSILSKQLDEIEPSLREQGVPITEEIEDIIFALKEGDLDRFIFERTQRKIPSGAKAPIFRSMERDYVHMATTPEFKKWASQAVYGDVERWGVSTTPSHAADLHSKFQKLGARRVNDEALAGRMTIEGPDGRLVKVPKGMRVFDEDPHLVNAIRTFYAQKAVDTSQILADLVKGYGLDLSTVPKALEMTAKGTARVTQRGQQLLKRRGLVPLDGIKGFEGMALPPEAADVVQRVFKVRGEATVAQEFFDSYNFVQNIWKAQTLMPFTDFHFRNLVSNQMLKRFAGMTFPDIPTYAYKAQAVLSAFEDPAMLKRLKTGLEDSGFSVGEIIGGDSLKVNGDDLSKLELLKLASDMGVIRSGQFGSAEFVTDFARTSSSAAREGASRTTRLGGKIGKAIGGETGEKVGKRAGAFARGVPGITIEGSSILRGGMKVAGKIEDVDRLSLFLWGLDQGMDARAARDLTAKWMVDYNNLTDFEKSVMKTAFPFYAWSRKVTPLMIEAAVSDPSKFAEVGRIKRSLEADSRAGDAPPERIVPEYIKEGLGVRYRQNEKGEYEYLLLNNWVPQGTLAEMDTPGEMADFVVGQLGPIPKTLIEQYFGEYTFFDREFAVGNVDFLGERIPDRLVHVMRNVRYLSVLDRFMRDGGDESTLNNMLRTFTGVNKIKVDVRQASAAARAEKMNEVQKIRSFVNGLRRKSQEAQKKGDTDRAMALKAEISGHLEEIRDILGAGR